MQVLLGQTHAAHLHRGCGFHPVRTQRELSGATPDVDDQPRAGVLAVASDGVAAIVGVAAVDLAGRVSTDDRCFEGRSW